MTGTKIVIAENNSQHFECLQQVCVALNTEHHPKDDDTFENMRGDYCLALEEGIIKKVADKALQRIKTGIAKFIGNHTDTVLFVISDQLKYRARDVTGIDYYNAIVRDFYPTARTLFVSDFALRKNNDQYEVLRSFCKEMPNCELIEVSKEHDEFKDIFSLALKRTQVLQRAT